MPTTTTARTAHRTAKPRAQKEMLSVMVPAPVLHQFYDCASARRQDVNELVSDLLEEELRREDERRAKSMSPSGDPWFDDPENVAAVMEGLEDAKAGRVQAYTLEELKEMLGL